MASEKAYARPDGPHPPGAGFSESGHAATSSSRGTDPGKDRNRGGDGSSARGTGEKVSARSHRLLSLRTAQEASPGTTSRLGSASWQNTVNATARFGSSQPQHSLRREVR